MTSTLLSSLKGSQLKQVATQCGILSSGTKSELCQRLSTSSSRSAEAASKKLRVLSIDMGIRNLAFCVLSASAFSGTPRSPLVEAWRRIALPKQDQDGSSLQEATGKSKKESFVPSLYASHAYTLLKKSILLHEPTHVLIERQRWRTMGGPTVQEWTLRVNMLESMFYAVLKTLIEEHAMDMQVIAVNPAQVAGFWLADDETRSLDKLRSESPTGHTGRQGRKPKSKAETTKGAKIDVVGRWLASGDEVSVAQGDAELTRKAFMEKWEGKGQGRRSRRKSDSDNGKETARGDVSGVLGTSSAVPKIDDLADCLLQGLAWVRWQENRATLEAEGPQALL